MEGRERRRAYLRKEGRAARISPKEKKEKEEKPADGGWALFARSVYVYRKISGACAAATRCCGKRRSNQQPSCCTAGMARR